MISAFVYFSVSHYSFFFFFNDTATTEIYTLSLHDALPIWPCETFGLREQLALPCHRGVARWRPERTRPHRSEEHTSELQSHSDLVCRLLLEKKKKTKSCNEHGRKNVKLFRHEHSKNLQTDI